MKLQDQVCTLEQSKRLKELGIDQQGLYEWRKMDEYEKYFIDHPSSPNEMSSHIATAFTVAELGVMIPS